MIIWIELMDILDDKQKLLFLDNYINEIPQMLIETIIIINYYMMLFLLD